MSQKKKILFITSEVSPFMPESALSKYTQEKLNFLSKNNFEVRVIAPKFGIINERKHQLHEVVRLSGINITVHDVFQPLVIKVASFPGLRVQIYFIDNNHYFDRKGIYNDENEDYYADNSERFLFFTKGAIETVKKLGWIPDIIYIQGLITYLIPSYIKTYAKNEPIFKNSKLVFQHFDDQDLTELFNYVDKITEYDKENLDYFKTIKNVKSLFDGHLDGLVSKESLHSELSDLSLENTLCVNLEDDTDKEAENKKMLEFYSTLLK